ncbi:hypothetical protein E2C01_052646 [Portunus trituberculatus]|uniref:Uncharacterized protein n=1 Tax=Portunus trituberculatus TaxID=210409 RepID=A0A5B7GM28_PORTR|nr:hypothetical protein [Portunus trituberculatus]
MLSGAEICTGQPLRTVEWERVRQRQPIPAPGAGSKIL